MLVKRFKKTDKKTVNGKDEKQKIYIPVTDYKEPKKKGVGVSG